MRVRKRPVYMIGVAADLIGVHPQTLRVYEQKGILCPRKSIKNTRLYSQEDVEKGQRIQELTQKLGLNLPGVKLLLGLEERVEELEEKNRRLRMKLEKQAEEHRREIQEVHRSYRRELEPLPRAEVSRRHF